MPTSLHLVEIVDCKSRPCPLSRWINATISINQLDLDMQHRPPVQRDQRKLYFSRWSSMQEVLQQQNFSIVLWRAGGAASYRRTPSGYTKWAAEPTWCWTPWWQLQSGDPWTNDWLPWMMHAVAPCRLWLKHSGASSVTQILLRGQICPFKHSLKDLLCPLRHQSKKLALVWSCWEETVDEHYKIWLSNQSINQSISNWFKSLSCCYPFYFYLPLVLHKTNIAREITWWKNLKHE